MRKPIASIISDNATFNATGGEGRGMFCRVVKVAPNEWGGKREVARAKVVLGCRR
jgi:hypothetical protein